MREISSQGPPADFRQADIAQLLPGMRGGSLRMPAGWLAEAAAYRSAVALLAAGAVICLVVFAVLWHHGLEEFEIDRQRVAGHRVELLQADLASHIDRLEALQAFLSGTHGGFGASAFDALAWALLRGHNGVRALLWIPRVAEGQREFYEQIARRDGRDGFSFLQRDEYGGVTVALHRSEYLPIYHIFGYANQSVLGLDLGLDPDVRPILDRARTTGRFAASGLIRMRELPGEPAVVLVAAPVYSGGTLDNFFGQWQPSLLGFAVAALRVDEILDQSRFPASGHAFDDYVFDGSTQDPDRLLHVSPASARNAGGSAPSFAHTPVANRLTYELRVADRSWKLVSVALTRPYYMTLPAEAWAIIASGFLLLLFAGFHAIAMIRKNRDLQRSADVLIGAQETLRQDVESRKKAEAELRSVEAAQRSALQRHRAQILAIGAVSRDDGLIEGDVDRVARVVTEQAAAAVGCERVNAWLFNDTESELRCIDLYESTPRRHSSGMILKESQFGPEFGVIRSSAFVDADDALADPRTAGYVEGYIRPLGIASMLDVAIRASGKTLGLLCFEHVGAIHHWEPDEIAFASQLADKIGFALANRFRRRSEENVRASEAALAEAQALAHVGSWDHDLRSGAIACTPETYRILGLDPAQSTTTYETLAAMLFPDDRERIEAAYAQAVRDRVGFAADYRMRRPDGDTIFVHGRSRVIVDADGKPTRMIGTLQDISERKKAEESIVRMATFDSLTGLVNRHVFVTQVKHAIAHARRSGGTFAVLYLDLDHFKDINDTLGHPVGDRLLRAVGERLKSCTREDDTVSRFGGDEFAILMNEIREPTDAGVLADKIIDEINRPFLVGTNEIRSGASIGVAVCDPEETDAESILAHADLALYRAKESRGTYRFFADAMDGEVRERVTLTSELRQAIGTDQLFLVYQPQVEADSGRIIGLEALVRWRHPRRGLLPPPIFIAAAEKSGLMIGLGNWILEQACLQVRSWLDAGISPPTVAVNLSAVQFKSPVELEMEIDSVLERTKVPRRLLEIELTETVLMETSKEHNDVVQRLRNSGIRLALDDFGTGYSSLGYLRRFPVDRIKIAQDFVKDMLGDTGDRTIVKAAIGLARELGTEVIAEGVETQEQLALLRAWGCRDVQGYLFAKPMTVADVTPLLVRGQIQVARQAQPALAG